MEEFKKEVYEEANENIQFQMKWALREKDYKLAYECAQKLSAISFMKHKDDILNCIEECADAGMIDAAVWMMDWYIAKGTGKMVPEAFPFLKLLAEAGYVRSFRWMADCYYFGIGCVRDEKMAARYYLEGFLFDRDEICGKRCRELYPRNEEDGEDHPIKALIRELILGENEDMARERIASLILDGVIADYEPQTAVFLLKLCHDGMWEVFGMSAFKLAECFVNGVGTEKNLFLALYFLEMATDELNYMPIKGDEEWQEEYANTLYAEVNFQAAYQAAEKMRREVMEEIRQRYLYFDRNEIYDVYEEWREKKEEFISRKRA